MTEWIMFSSLLMIGTLLLRKLLRNRISRALQYALWLPVLIRLLCPISLFEIPIPAAQLVLPSETILSESIEPAEFPPVAEAAPTIPKFDVSEKFDEHTSQISLPDLLKTVWTCGSVFCGFWFLFVHLHFSHSLQKKRIRWSAQNQKLPIYIVPDLASPCLFGIVHPAIYLTPQAVAPGIQTNHVILHELVHYRHGDHIWSLLRCLCLIIFWWNPLVWIAVCCSRQDGELCCDESVMHLCGDRLAYGKTLLDVIARKPSLSAQTVAMMFSEVSNMKERLKNITGKHNTTKPVMLLALCAALLFTACSFVKPVETNQPSDSISTTSEQNQTGSDQGINITKVIAETWLDYADSISILFHNSHGVFLYDREAEELITIMTFPTYFGTNTLWSPGVSEPSIQVTVSADGSSAMIFCRGQESTTEKTTYYLNLNTGELTQDVYGKMKTVGSTSDFGERGDDALDLLERTSGNVAESTSLHVINCLILNNHHIGHIHTNEDNSQNLYYTEYNELGEAVAEITLLQNYAD